MRVLLIACVALAGCPDDGGGGYAVPADGSPDEPGPADGQEAQPPAKPAEGPVADAPSSGNPPTTSTR